MGYICIMKYTIPDEQVLAEYNSIYRKEPTPATHPELYDPLNPPENWTYDAWHAFWYYTGPNDSWTAREYAITTVTFIVITIIVTVAVLA